MKKTVRWIGTVVGLIVFVVLVLIGVGTSLPVRHVATCSADLTIHVDPIWKAVYDVEGSTWRSNIARVDFPSPGAAVGDKWIEVDRSGNSIEYQRVSAVRDRRLVVRVVGQSAPFGGEWTYQFSPLPVGTRLSITEDGQIYNPIFRLMARYVTGYTSTMRTYLTDLGTHFGESPSVVCTDITPH
jgi:hypothetical protein